MKKLLTLSALIALIFTMGCSTVQQITPPVVRQGVSTGVSYSIVKYPEAIPYLRAVTPIVCSAANGTNLAPAEVIAAIEESNASIFKTPESVLILNGALTLYIGVWASYGEEAVANAPTLKLYLQATCDGLNDGLSSINSINAVNTRVDSKFIDWPLVKF